MDIVVLAKYVADVEDVPPDAWDYDTGTLKRGRLHMVTNPLDNHALRLAKDIRSPSGGRIAVLSMGPESAERVCRRGLAYGADEAVLISDRAFAGADTLATARVLAAALRKAEESLGIRSPLILAGMQSPDGDTAQVPAELAALLGLPLLPYVTDVELDAGGMVFHCLERTGHARYALHSSSALATVTSYTPPLPFHTSLADMRRAASATVHRWGVPELGLPAEEVGLAGSATRVVNIESVSSRRERSVTVSMEDSTATGEQLAGLVRSLDGLLGSSGRSEKTLSTTPDISPGEPPPERGPGPDGTEAAAAQDNSDHPATPGTQVSPVFSVIEEDPTGPTEASLELLGAARALADVLGVEAVAVRLARKTTAPGTADQVVHTLYSAGARRILSVREAEDTPRCPTHHLLASLLSHAVAAHRPQIVLAPASPLGRVVAPLCAAEAGAGLTADCTGLSIGDYTNRKEGRTYRSILHQTRPALGGNILATIVSVYGRPGAPQMATVRGGVFRRRSYPGTRVAQMELKAPALQTVEDLRCLESSRPSAAGESSGGVQGDAEVVVSVGVGVGSREKVENLVRPLMKAIGERWKLTVSLACSRAAVEANILPYSYQVGQTGRTVRPELYVALGISGAIQHRLGMQGSGSILAINPDEDAEIMAISDYAVVGTLEEALPLLTRRILESPDSGQEQ